MMKHIEFRRPQVGFSLVEMAIVLTIVALLLGGLLPTISGQIEQQRRNETRKQLDDIQQALLGFAIINGRLPCPIDSTITNPTNASYGLEAANCSADVASEGYLPWKTLGISETDAWGTKRSSTASPWNGYWRYRVDRNFATTTILMTTAFCTGTNDCLLVKDSSGNNLTETAASKEHPVAIIYSTGPNLTADGQNATYEATNGIYQSDVAGVGFDDLLVWISRPQLFNRMVTAGKLP